MQEFGSDGGVGRVFGAAELRMPMGYVAAAPLPHPHPHPHPHLQPPPPPPPQIKCPRCESTNTKFCYYNNYNLSQPRHFCKSCRRYWTKGGVLRNVPVGGGCRKSKRASSKPSSSSSSSSPSKPSSSSPSSSSAAAPAAVAASDKDHRPRPPSSASRSSSDSSTLTAAADHPSSSNPNPNPFETLPQAPRIFPEPSGTFANLMSAGSGVLDLGFPHPPPAPLQSQQSKSAAEEAIGAQQGFADQTVGMDLTPPFQGRSNGGGGLTLNGLDWPGTVEPTLFDLSGAVDHWNPSHWGDTDPSLYLP